MSKILAFTLVQIRLYRLTLRCVNDHGVHVPVVPDLAQTLKVGSDHSENLTMVFFLVLRIVFFESCLKLRFFNLIFTEEVAFMVRDVIRA